MKIEKIEVIQCRIPFFKPFVRSQKIGTINDCTAILVKVVTDGGQTGIGETNPVIHLTSEDAHMVNHVLHARLSPALLGADPRNIQKIHAIMDDVAPGLEVPKAAIDMACYDILGKSAGLCTGDLLGGVLHDKLPIMWTVGMGTPEENAQEAQQMKEKGFTSLMIKVNNVVITWGIKRDNLGFRFCVFEKFCNFIDEYIAGKGAARAPL